MTTPIDEVERAIEDAIGREVKVVNRAPLGGGCISHIERLDTTAGPFVLKWLPDAPPGLFEAEAAGLRALRESGTSLVVPQVVTSSFESRVGGHQSSVARGAPPPRAPSLSTRATRGASGASDFLVLEYLPPDQRRVDFDETLGRGLAALHRATSTRFGFAQDTYCGTTLQPNAWMEQWLPFYATARLGFQLDLAVRAGQLGSHDRERVARVITRLDTWLEEPSEGPALIHGDLWSGNLHVTGGGRPALIDPAAYYGHREAELGMMTLFGGFSARTFDAYHEAFPLDPGWRERNALYQLYHVMNHVNLFGSSYLGQMQATVKRFA